MARSRSESIGRPSIDQTSIAWRSARTPCRPGRAWTTKAASSALRETNRAASACPTASTTPASSTAPRSQSVRRMFVHAMPERRCGGDRWAWSRGRWTTTPSSTRTGRRSGMRMSTGSATGRATPQRCAAERCEASTPGPAASTAAMIRCSGVSAVPTSRVTLGWTGTSVPARIARSHALLLRPLISRLTTPWFRRASRSSSSNRMHQRGCHAPATGLREPGRSLGRISASESARDLPQTSRQATERQASKVARTEPRPVMVAS